MAAAEVHSTGHWHSARNRSRVFELYSVVVAQKPGVLCKSCGRGIEVDDDYLPGIQGAEMAASLYGHFSTLAEEKIVDSAIRPWQKALTCENPDCRKTYTYGTDDLCLYDG
jgi:hypothetical protein